MQGGFDPTRSRYESRFIDAGNLKTHYLEAGEGEPVVLVHGGGPGADGYGNWHGCIPRFAREFRTIAVDMIGFGRTAKPDPAAFTYSQEARTDHLVAFLGALGLERVTLVGNSMGGITSLGVALKRPDLAKKLVLMGPAGIKSAGIPAALKPLMEYDGSATGMKSVMRALTHEDFVIDEDLLQYRVALSNQDGARRALAATMQWVKGQHGLYFENDVIRRVKTPTLVIGGKDDPIVPPEHIYKFLELIENSRGYLLPRCGHWVMNEHPDEFVDVATRFIKHA